MMGVGRELVVTIEVHLIHHNAVRCDLQELHHLLVSDWFESTLHHSVHWHYLTSKNHHKKIRGFKNNHLQHIWIWLQICDIGNRLIDWMMHSKKCTCLHWSFEQWEQPCLHQFQWSQLATDLSSLCSTIAKIFDVVVLVECPSTPNHWTWEHWDEQVQNNACIWVTLHKLEKWIHPLEECWIQMLARFLWYTLSNIAYNELIRDIRKFVLKENQLSVSRTSYQLIFFTVVNKQNVCCSFK